MDTERDALLRSMGYDDEHIRLSAVISSYTSTLKAIMEASELGDKSACYALAYKALNPND